ncbi:MAG: Rid family hydrolase [Devosia sp.]
MSKSIVPASLDNCIRDWRMSPGLEHDGFVFMTGFTGAGPNGALSNEPREQIEHAFAKVGPVLEVAWLDWQHIVEMTSYHAGLHDHLDIFKNIRTRHVRDPYPAWTAVEVAGFVREGAIVELRCIARRT